MKTIVNKVKRHWKFRFRILRWTRPVGEIMDTWELLPSISLQHSPYSTTIYFAWLFAEFGIRIEKVVELKTVE